MNYTHWENRIKDLMAQVGMPESQSLAVAFKQLANEVMQAALLPRIVSQKCWCESCDLAANNGLRSRMSVCPECGDKRCAKAKHHDSNCTANEAKPGSAEEFATSDSPRCKDGKEACIDCLCIGKCLAKEADK